MTADVYFSHEARSAKAPLLSRYTMLNLVCRGAHQVFPDLSVRIVRSLLSRPAAAARRGGLFGEYQRETVKCDAGAIQIYSLGEGPVVLFSHGWSGNASQFDFLMQEVASRGYRCVAFDHFRHGSSTGSDSNYPLFIEAIHQVRRSLVDRAEQVTAVIGHSIGGMASLIAFDDNPVPHLLISPVVGVYPRFRQCALSAGIPESLIRRIARSVEADCGRDFITSDDPDRLLSFAAEVKLIHSSNDRVVPQFNSLKLLKKCPSLDLDVGSYGGHTSILKKENTRRMVSAWLQQY